MFGWLFRDGDILGTGMGMVMDTDMLRNTIESQSMYNQCIHFISARRWHDQFTPDSYHYILIH